MTPATVITAVRNRLGDSMKERWDDSTLLLYVSLAQNDICMFTSFYRLEHTITLRNDQFIYTLPSDCLAVNRLEYNGKLVPIETRANIDAQAVRYPLVLKDNLPFNEIEFKVGEDDELLITAMQNVFGVVTEIIGNDDCSLDDDFGIVVEVEGVEVEVEDVNVLVYYIGVPALLDMDMTDPENPVLPSEELLLPDIWFQAFLHYVSGMALQDDNDANNIQRGEMEGAKYLRMLGHIQKTAAKDFTSNVRTKLTTRFRRT